MKILIIDIETTGFLNAGGKIVEVGMVELDLNTGERINVFDAVCRERNMTWGEITNSWVVNNSDLSADEVFEAPYFDEYAEEIQAIIDDYPAGATAFNRSFDFDFLESRGIRFQKKLDCPMLLSTDICKLPGRYGNYKWPKVEEAYDFFFPSNDYIEKHRGADDALHEAEIVYELHKLGHYSI